MVGFLAMVVQGLLQCPNRMRSSDARERGRHHSHAPARAKTTSRAISWGYLVSVAPIVAAAAEAAAVDGQPAGPGLRDAEDEDHHEQRRGDGGRAGEQPEHEQHAEDDLEERQGEADGVGQAVREQLVGLHRALGGQRVADLGRTGVDEHDAEEDPQDEPDDVEQALAPGRGLVVGDDRGRAVHLGAHRLVLTPSASSVVSARNASSRSPSSPGPLSVDTRAEPTMTPSA